MNDGMIRLLAEAYFDNSLSAAQAEELVSLLQSSQDNREVFLQELEMCNLLAHVDQHFVDGEAFERAFWERVRAEDDMLDFTRVFTERCREVVNEQDMWDPQAWDTHKKAEDTQKIKQYAERQLRQFLEEQETHQNGVQADRSRAFHLPTIDISAWGRKLSAAVTHTYRSVVFAALLLAVGLAVYAAIHAVVSRRVVATLDASLEAQWEHAPQDNQLRRGRLHLEQGWAELSFVKGTKVLLQAPCVFDLLSSNAMFLDSGSVTAQILRKEAQGFTIDTSHSRIKDYGTAFGVLMDASQQAEIQVFEGEVGVRSTATQQSSETFRLKRGQNALATSSKGVQVGMAIHGANHFIRRMPDPNTLGIPGKRIDLADIVGGGNGFGTGRVVPDRGHPSGTINPYTGRINDMGRPSYAQANGNPPKALQAEVFHPYLPVDALPLVDGIFIPNSYAQGCTVTSKGHVFAQCPRTDGYAMMNVANGWNLQFKSGTAQDWFDAHGISMHANLGITFDLQAIRDTMPGIDIVRFVTRAGIPFSTEPAVSEADIWILVDGTTRFQKTDIHPPLMLAIDIPLAKQERFLTLVVTDGTYARGGAKKPSAWDWVFFSDPILELKTAGPVE